VQHHVSLFFPTHSVPWSIWPPILMKFWRKERQSRHLREASLH
jgi:hypothetical protein